MTNFKHSTRQYHIKQLSLAFHILDPITCFGDFREYYSVLLRVTNFFGDGEFWM